MNLYISDTHFGHANVIRFDGRPFETVQEMDEILIKLWNNRVRPDDDVWFLGDLCHKSGNPPEWYLRRLMGRKHLVVGNHDLVILNSPQALSYFESVDQIAQVTDGYQGENIQIILCHYPILQWAHKHHGSWHIYGHIHTDTGEAYQIMSSFDRALNAGAPINNYTPVSLRELVENNKAFREKVRHHAFVNDKYGDKGGKK